MASGKGQPMSHTPEPWHIEEGDIFSSEGNIANVFGADGSHPQAAANAARIVSCINGCAGLNPASYRQVVEALNDTLTFLLAYIKSGQRNEQGQSVQLPAPYVLESKVSAALVASVSPCQIVATVIKRSGISGQRISMSGRGVRGVGATGDNRGTGGAG